MQVWITPADRDGTRWRIQVETSGRVRVFRRTGRSIGQASVSGVTNVGALGRWLLERGIDPDDLTPA
jgi:hypothetical protein